MLATALGKIDKCRKKSQSLCEDLNRSQKYFFIGAALLLISVLSWTVSVNRGFLLFLTLGGLFLVAGVISDLLSIYTRIWRTLIGKGLILLVYALATTTAYALAAQIVNSVVGFESSNLDNAAAFVAVLLVPFFLFGITYFVFAVIFLFGQLYMAFLILADKFYRNECLKSIIPINSEKYPARTFLARLVIYPAALGFLWGAAEKTLPVYEIFIEKSAASFIYHLEALQHSRCTNIPDGNKVIHINTQEIIVASKQDGQFIFSPQACTPSISPD